MAVAIDKCTNCVLGGGVHDSNCILCEGKATNGLMIVGGAPGRTEDAQGRNFVGDAGIALDRILKRAEIVRADCALTTVVRCFPPGNRDPRPDEYRECVKYLITDIATLRPRVVVLMGNTPLTAVLDKTGITKVRGSVFSDERFPGVHFLPTLHPSMTLRKPVEFLTILHDLKKAKQICDHGYSPPEVSYTVCRSVKEIEKLLQRLEASTTDYVSYDTETSGFDYREDKVACISLSNCEGTGWLIPILGQGLRHIWPPDELIEIFALLKRFFEDPSIPKSGQNLVFDRLMLRGNFGIEVKGEVIDTMLAHHVVDENQPHGLDFIESWYTDIDSYKGNFKDHLPKSNSPFTDAPEDILWEYACGDADGTYRATQALEREMAIEGTRELHDRIMLPLSKVLGDAEWNGILVDMEEVERQHVFYMDQYRQIERRVFRIAGEEINLNSPQQKARMLYEVLGLPILKRTPPSKTKPNGNPSTDAGTLKLLSEQVGAESAGPAHAVPAMLIELSSLAHDINNYLKGMNGKSGILKHIGPDGRMHVRWMLHRAVTGRLSSYIHSIKRPEIDDEGVEIANFRKLFVPTKGWHFISADYKQMEAYVVGYVAPDEYLMSLHKDPNADVHRLVAAQIFGITEDEVTKLQRGQAKGVVFGLNYGRTKYTIATEFGITMAQAEKYIRGYFDLFKGVEKHFRTCRKMVDDHGVVVTPFGRKRHLAGATWIREALQKGLFRNKNVREDAKNQLDEMYRQAVNMTIQSAANDILGLACIRIAERFDELNMKSRILISHHDAWCGEAPDDELEDAVTIVKEEMERPVPEIHNASFEADFKVGRYWGDASVTIKGICEAKGDTP